MKNVYSVSWVNAYLKDLMTSDILLKSLYVKGEASNVKYHSSGHLYFTLKEKDAIIQCAMFKGYQAKGLHFRLKDGDEVVVKCFVDLYEKGGVYKLVVTEMYTTGAGKINEAYEKLKEELAEMGMFDDCYKRPLPSYINRIGLIAAYPGEAVHDVVENATRNNPYIEILIYPSYVQGEKAPLSIVNGIRALEKKNADVIILGRGGGSVEDLWAFNERIVAEAIFNCEIPVVSAIGHEQQVSIADLVADVRVSTPTAAALTVTQNVHELLESFDAYEEKYYEILNRKIRTWRLAVANQQKRLQSLSYTNKIKEQRLRLEHDTDKLNYAMEKSLQKRKYRMERDTDSISHYMNTKLEAYKKKMAIAAGGLEAMSPLAKLAGGYAFVRNSQGKKVTKAGELQNNEVLTLHYTDGYAKAKITDVQMKG